MTIQRENLQELRQMLSDCLPWSPLDFIKAISLDGDKKLYAHRLISEIDEENDLRFTQKLPNGENIILFAEKLAWDTKFFGYGVGKLLGIFPLDAPFYRPESDYAPAILELLKKSESQNVQYLFAAVDPRDLATLRALGETGFSLIETRAYYHMDIRQYSFPERFAVRPANTDDIQSLGQAAVKMINSYDRFHADPFIHEEAANRLMYKWIEASILNGFADVTIVPDAVAPTAFCTVKYHKDCWSNWNLRLSQPIFSVVSPEYKGWYKKIISEINYHLCDIGVEHSYLITQATNKAVIWVWESLGYRFGKCELIFRKIIK